jgi:hypothetical protein
MPAAESAANYRKQKPNRDVAQPGSALAWGARGRKFESCHPDPSKQRASEISEALYFLTGLHMVYINDFLLSLYQNTLFLCNAFF